MNENISEKKMGSRDALMKLRRLQTEENASAVKDDTLVILQDLGYDQGVFSHIKVSIGMVDVRTLVSDIDEDGYQRELNNKRLKDDMLTDFHISRFDPITISIRDGKRYVVDGQKRTVGARILYKNGVIKTPMVPCRILQNSTKEEDALWFSMQDDGVVKLKPQEKFKAKVNSTLVSSSTDLNNILNKNGLPILGSRSVIKAAKAIEDIYSAYGNYTTEKIAFVISQAWRKRDGKLKENAVHNEILKGIAVFYSKYGTEINDKNLITRLSGQAPDEVLHEFKVNTSKLDKDKKYITTFLKIYNGGRGNKKYKIEAA